LSLKGNPLNPRFESLLALKFGENLQDALTACFQSGPMVKKTSTKKSETPSWLFEDKKQEVFSPISPLDKN